MKRLSFLLVSFALVFFFIGIASAARVEVKDVSVAGQSIKGGESLELVLTDLEEGKVIIRGKAQGIKTNVEKVEISLDEGRFWEPVEGIEEWTFSFVPEDGKNYPVSIRALDTKGKKSRLVNVDLSYRAITLTQEEQIRRMLRKLEDIYTDEDQAKFLSYFSEEDYPDYYTFVESIEYTFDNNNNLKVKITPQEIRIEGQAAIVKADYNKTWDTGSSRTGKNKIIRLKKIGGIWKITSLEDERMFTIGSGRVSGSVTDR